MSIRKRDYFNKIHIIKGLILAFCMSAFIYLAYFNIEYKLLNSILGIFAIYFLLSFKKQSLFYAGFFVGLLWFYWLSFSLVYYDLAYLMPLLILFLAFAYGLIFYLIAVFDNIFLKALLVFLLSYFHLLGFNWFIPELIFVDSYFSSSKLSFGIILLTCLLAIKYKKTNPYIFILLYFSLNIGSNIKIQDINIKITMPEFEIKQNEKWIKTNKINLINKNIELINTAIKNKFEVIILPETTFPVLLNKNIKLMNVLLEKSKQIDIIAGALYYENEQYYNVTFHFSQNSYKIAKKYILVPFGEEIPLPSFFTKIINDIFYKGAKDYAKANKPTNLNIKGIKFRNAICYEASSEGIYKNLKGIKYMIATSNNAWFTPSIEPVLQKILLKHYSKKYNITIYHSINGSANYIIKP